MNIDLPSDLTSRQIVAILKKTDGRIMVEENRATILDEKMEYCGYWLEMKLIQQLIDKGVLIIDNNVGKWLTCKIFKVQLKINKDVAN